MSLSFNYRIGRSAVCHILDKVPNKIWATQSPTAVAFPCSTDEWVKISNDLWHLWGFPLCLEAIDGKHCLINCPTYSGSSFYNYKGTVSLVLMAVIRNAFGILSSRWRCLRSPIEMQPHKASKSILATIALHNWLLKRNNSQKSCGRLYCSTGYTDYKDFHGSIHKEHGDQMFAKLEPYQKSIKVAQLLKQRLQKMFLF